MAVGEIPQIDDIEVTPGDYFPLEITFDTDYETISFVAEVRRRRNKDSELLAAFVIDSQSYTDPTTTLLVHLDEEDTRAIGDNGGAWWDIQAVLGAGTKTLWCGYLPVSQDVTE
jgi:hypothetical protein